MTGFNVRKTWLAASLLVGAALTLGAVLEPAQPPEERALPVSKIRVPVSINALMVTLIDHSAHYIWDYASNTRFMGDTEWQAIEYYAIQLAAAGPLITLGGSGVADDAWAESEEWTRYAREMTEAAQTAMNAARLHDDPLLDEAGDRLVAACEGCHEAFKPELPTEGITHDPYYDHLYHLFLAEPGVE